MLSMTGFGRGEASNGDASVIVEMKSVNNRFRDVNLRLPREYLLLEPRVANLLRDRISRGRLDVFVRRSAGDSGQGVRADLPLALRTAAAIREVANALGQPDAPVPLAVVLAQPGVLTVSDAEPDALAEWALLEVALEAAISDLEAMRAREGEALRLELHRHLDDLARLRAEVSALSEGAAERQRVRLEDRLLRLLGDKLDPTRLIQEAALLADKADISEELARLHSHLDQVRDALDAAEPVGRKLEFLVQELHREINTIGSKANETPTSARVVEMKSVLERIREQAANVE